MGLFSKGSKAYSILEFKCPTCHSSDLFYTGSFSFKRSFDMKTRCDHCGQNFMPEPGFYYGAMFISYIFMGWFSIAFIAVFHWILGWSTMASFALLIVFCVIFFVYIFRLARAIWLNINFRYNASKADGHK